MRVNVVDLETEEALARPDYPPRPVGAALWLVGRAPRYLAWGHPTENNVTERDARRVLADVWREAARRDGVPLLCHRARFDLDVAEERLGLAPPPWDRWHCTELLAFLDDPHRVRLGLKPLAKDLLDWDDAADVALRDWIAEHVPEARSGGRWGRFISRAPGRLVGAYAVDDVRRTRRLFEHFVPRVIVKHEMMEPYDRERRLTRHLLASERRGIPVAARPLRRAVAGWEADLERVDEWVRRRLRAPVLEVDKGRQLADALDAAGKVGAFVLTPKGNRSTSFDNLLRACEDRLLVEVLGFRGRLTNGLRTFARPWLASAERTGGTVHPEWHQVRQDAEEGRRVLGARTGRLSTTPNWQNLPTPRDRPFRLPVALARDLAGVYRSGVPDLRRFVVPPERGWVLNDRDYSQHELRILAHYAGGELREAYLANPRLDHHGHAQQLINGTLGTSYGRKPVKNTGLGIIYGMGLRALADRIDDTVEVARALRAAYRRIFPGIRELEDELKRRGYHDEPIRTWGGRVYYVEPPKFVRGVLRTFEYKLLNVLIQGSAADCLKEAWIRYEEAPGREARLLLTAHDEFLTAADRRRRHEEMAVLRAAMESVEFTLPMLSDGSWSPRSWAELRSYRDGN